MFKPKYKITDAMAEDLSGVEFLMDKTTSSKILPKYEAEVRKRATVEATHSSVSIENNPLNFSEVDRLLAEKPKLSRGQYAEIEVRNYKDALDFINKRKQQKVPIAPQDILDLHFEITKDLLDKTRAGRWRKNSVYIENQDGEVIYTAVSPDLVLNEIKELLVWIKNDAQAISPVIAAGILHLQFVSIHPFADGNGRTARALTMLYLGLREADCRGTLVLDSYYADNRRNYYDALASAQGDNYAASQRKDMTTWLGYFVAGFLSAIKVLYTEIKMINVGVLHKSKSFLSQNEKSVLSYANEFGSVNLEEAQDILADCSRRTVQRILAALVEGGFLTRVGETHQARYIVKR